MRETCVTAIPIFVRPFPGSPQTQTQIIDSAVVIKYHNEHRKEEKILYEKIILQISPYRFVPR